MQREMRDGVRDGFLKKNDVVEEEGKENGKIHIQIFIKKERDEKKKSQID